MMVPTGGGGGGGGDTGTARGGANGGIYIRYQPTLDQFLYQEEQVVSKRVRLLAAMVI